MEFTTMGVSYGTGIGRDFTARCHKWGKGKLAGLSAEKLEENECNSNEEINKLSTDEPTGTESKLFTEYVAGLA